MNIRLTPLAWGAAIGLAMMISAPGSGGLAQEAAVSGPITIVIPRGPGGANDVITRYLQPRISEELGVQVVIENIQGGGGVTGLTQARSRPADGHTWVSWSPPGEYMQEKQGNLPFPADSFVPIAIPNFDVGLIAVSLDSPYQTFTDLVEATRAGEGSATVGVTQIAGNDALGILQIASAFDLDWAPVAYTSGGETTAAVIGGHVDLAVRAGGWADLHEKELRILAVVNDERLSELPDVPTIYESGEVPPGTVVWAGTRGVAVRAETPPEVLDKLNSAMQAVMTDPAVAAGMYDATGFRPGALDMEASRELDAAGRAVVDRYFEQLGQ